MPNLEALVQTVSKRIHTSSKYTARLQRHVFERLARVATRSAHAGSRTDDLLNPSPAL